MIEQGTAQLLSRAKHRVAITVLSHFPCLRPTAKTYLLHCLDCLTQLIVQDVQDCLDTGVHTLEMEPPLAILRFRIAQDDGEVRRMSYHGASV